MHVYVHDLKEKVKEERPDVLKHIVPAMLTVWRCTDSEIDFGNKDSHIFKQKLNEVFFPTRGKSRSSNQMRMCIISRIRHYLSRVSVRRASSSFQDKALSRFLRLKAGMIKRLLQKKFNELLHRSAIHMPGDKFRVRISWSTRSSPSEKTIVEPASRITEVYCACGGRCPQT